MKQTIRNLRQENETLSLIIQTENTMKLIKWPIIPIQNSRSNLCDNNDA